MVTLVKANDKLQNIYKKNKSITVNNTLLGLDNNLLSI